MDPNLVLKDQHPINKFVQNFYRSTCNFQEKYGHPGAGNAPKPTLTLLEQILKDLTVVSQNKCSL